MLNSYKIIDLTQCLSPNSPSYEASCGFIIQERQEEDFRIQHFSMPAGMGTHMDAPSHCFAQGLSIAELSLKTLFSECVVVDVSLLADEKFILNSAHLAAWENQHGLIRQQSFVIIHTGWGRLFNDPQKYRNNLQFPSISSDAAKYLLERNIRGLGVDTLSPDLPEPGFLVHKLLLGAQKYIIENIAHADKLPATGSFALALPLKIKDASEAPMRLVAFIPGDKNLREKK